MTEKWKIKLQEYGKQFNARMQKQGYHVKYAPGRLVAEESKWENYHLSL